MMKARTMATKKEDALDLLPLADRELHQGEVDWLALGVVRRDMRQAAR